MHSLPAKIASAILLLTFLLTASAYSHATVDCTFSKHWSAGGEFLTGDYARSKGLLYKAKRKTTTEKPDSANTSGPWEYLGVCASHTSEKCDFNGDGKMDLAQGFPYANLIGPIISYPPGRPPIRENQLLYSVGEVSITYGNTSPETPPNEIWNQNGLGMFPYVRRDANFGHILSTGDFNNDNFCDLAIAAPRFSYSTSFSDGSRGLVNILYGSPNGLTISVLGENGRPINPYDAQRFDQDTPGLPEASEKHDQFGSALASGDFNGDGYDDLAVGSPGESTVVVQQWGEFESVGYFNIIYGSRRGLQTSAPAAVGYFQNLLSIPLYDLNEGDAYASALAAADFDNDGYADLVIAAPGENQRKGMITLLRGASTGIDIRSRRDFDLMNFKPEIGQHHAHFGRDLRTSDYNSDGFADLEIDFQDSNQFGSGFDGTIYVRGSASGLIINH